VEEIPGRGFCLPNMLRSMKHEGCFLCDAVIADSEHILNSLFCEGNADAEIREEIILAGGLCNWYAWRATFILSASDELAILYHSLLEKLSTTTTSLIKSLEGTRDPRMSLPLWPARTDALCPVCKWNHTLEKSYLSDLLDFFRDNKFALEFKNSYGLCFPHLQMATDEFPSHANLSGLLEMEQKKFSALLAQLAQFDRKRDSQSAKEPKDNDRASWRLAIELFVGKRGVFPRQ
jgi:hypothetical protein